MGFQILSNIMCVGLLPMLLINMVLSIATIHRASYHLLSDMFQRLLRLAALGGPPPHPAMNVTDFNESNTETTTTTTTMMDPFPPPHRQEVLETYPYDDDELRRSLPLFVYDPSDPDHIRPGSDIGAGTGTGTAGGGEGGVRVPDLCGRDCSVCLSEFQEGEEIHILPRCNHVFHKVCLSRWLDHDHTTCPLCRMSIGRGLGLGRREVEEENAEQYLRHRERELSEELIFWFSSNFHGSIGFPSFWCHA